jgi:hypothetical protein
MTFAAKKIAKMIKLVAEMIFAQFNVAKMIFAETRSRSNKLAEMKSNQFYSINTQFNPNSFNKNYFHSFKSLININRSFFREGGDLHKLGFGVELWKGAYASVRPSEIGLTWNIDSEYLFLFYSFSILK